MSGFRLVLDPTACDGHGLCAELFPEGVRLDDWGYPVVAGPVVAGPVVAGPVVAGPVVPARLLPHARRCVAACPQLALRLVPAP
jgi:ferredoxin